MAADKQSVDSKPVRRRPTPRMAQAATQERQALELRKAGVTFQQIAAQLGYRDAAGAHKAVTRALDRVPAMGVEELREVDSERLERLLLAVWQQAISGDLKAIDRALRILDQRARLLGLEVPKSVAAEVSVHPGVPAEVEKKLAAARAAVDGHALVVGEIIEGDDARP